jgi:Tol biopolymer transport system component
MLLTALLLATLIPVNTDSSNLYFHNSNFTADLKYLIYAHDHQIYKFNLATKENTQLTNTPGVDAHGAMPDRFHPNRVLYGIGRELWQVDVETKATKKLGEAPTTAKGLGQPSLSHDGAQVAVYFKSGDKSWEIGLIHLETGAYKRVIEQGFSIGHIQHSYQSPLIFYTWETSGYAPQRTWLVNADGTGNRPFYFATEPAKWLTPLKEWITHEAWIPGTGDMTMIFDKYGILRVTPDGAAKVIVRGHYWHAQATRDGKQLIADDFDGRLWLINAVTGETTLLAENLRKPGEQHIHPSIDPTGQWVVVNTGKNVAVLKLRP